MKNSAQVIAEGLYAAGSRYAFGIPGGEVLVLMEAMREAGIQIQLARHENCAGFMAEGMWHGTGAPAILFATIGPGIANAVNVIANAWQDRVPMIVLTGCVSGIDAHTYTHQVFDHVALLDSVTKAAFRVESGAAAIVIDKALSIATTGRPGPVLLDVPMDVQTSVEDRWVASKSIKQSAMVPADASVSLAVTWLEQSVNPLIIAGVDAVNQNVSVALDIVCHQLGAPLVTTYKAKGLVAEDDPLVIGGAGLSPLCDEQILPLVKQSDCVILAGYDPIEMRTGWRNPFEPEQHIIEISVEPNTHYMHQAAINFTGDIVATLSKLSDGIKKSNSWKSNQPKIVKDKLRQIMRVSEQWGPAAIVDEARKACPRNAVATVDSGAHRIVLSQIWECYQPRGLLQSNGLCTMGCAVPLAIGRKLAEPDRPVIAFVGDAGLEMFLGELATARDLALGIPVIVFVDHQLALIELKQRASRFPSLGIEFGATNFDNVARAMGGFGVTVQNRAELKQAIESAFAQNSFTLVSAMIGSHAYDNRI